MSIKTAQGNPQFERSFADLAYSILRDKAPKLLDYMVGFQVVDKSDDESQAVGVFGFRVSKQWFYAPVFFLNGELKGSELLYIKEQDTFVPLQENWVNYLVNRKPVSMGEASPYTERELRLTSPDYRVFSRSPIRHNFSKAGAAEYTPERKDEVYGYWGDGQRFDLRPAMRCFEIEVDSPAFQKAAANMDLEHVLKVGGRPMRRALTTLMAWEPRIKQAVSKLYGDRDLLRGASEPPIVARPVANSALESIQISRDEFNWHTKRAAAGVLPPAKVLNLLVQAGARVSSDVRTLLPQLLRAPRELPQVEKSAEMQITILTPDSLSEDMTDGEKTEVMHDGFAVRNPVEDSEAPEVFFDDASPDVTAVDATGVYAMLTSRQGLREALVLKSPLNIGGGVSDQTVVVDCADRSWDTLEPERIRVLRDTEPGQAAWHTFYKGLPSVESIEPGKAYCILSPVGIGTLPFKVLSRSGTDVNVTQFDLPGCERSLLLDARSSVIKGIGNMLVVPLSCKVVDIGSQRGLTHAPGSTADAQLFTLKSSEYTPVSLWSATDRFQVEHDEVLSEPLTKTATAIELVRRFRVAKSAALKMLEDVRRPGHGDFIIKYAQPQRVLGGSDMMAANTGALDNVKSYDPQIQAPMEAPESYSQVVGGVSNSGNEQIYDPMQVEPHLMRAVSDAANKGQKEVFDTGILSGLVKMVDVDPMVDKYLGDLVVGEDRLGRLLFLSYWHHDKFIDRYGETEMQELEDTLKNSFKSVGDLILFLKKKTVEPSADVIGSDVDLEG